MQIYFHSQWNTKIAPLLPGAERFIYPISRYLRRKHYPDNLVLFTLELHDVAARTCEIILVCDDSGRHLGRIASYEQCIFSHYSSRLDQVIVLPDVKSLPGYLSLSQDVNSEIFFEHRYSKKYSWIMNGEFSSQQIETAAAQWFHALVAAWHKEG